MLDRGFEVGQIDPTLFTKRVKGELFLCQLYVDDIIFGSSNEAFNVQFLKLMMGELSFFLGFEIKKLRGGTFISQAKYVQDMLKRFKMNDAKPKLSPKQTKCHLKRNPAGKDVDQKLYRYLVLCFTFVILDLILC